MKYDYSNSDQWFPRYHELRNRQDSRGGLTISETMELNELETVIVKLGQMDDQLNEASTGLKDNLDSSGASLDQVGTALTQAPAITREKQDYQQSTALVHVPKQTQQAQASPGDSYPPPPPNYPPPPPPAFPPMPPVFVGGGSSGGRPPTFAQSSGFGEHGPWALEATTQPRLVEIRDAIRALTSLQGGSPGSGYGGTGPNGKKKEEKDKSTSIWALQDQFIDAAAVPSFSPHGGAQSGPNMARLYRTLKGTATRLGSSLRGIRWKPKKPSQKPGGSPLSPETKGNLGAVSVSSMQVTASAVYLSGVISAGSSPQGPEGESSSGGGRKALVSVAGELLKAGGGDAGGAAGAGGTGGGGAGATAAAAGGAADALATVGTAAAGAATAIIAIGVAAFEAGKAIYQFARSQEQEIRKLGQVGGQQASAVAHLDVERTLRDVKTASETGESSQQLTQSLSKFEDALRPIESILTSIANTVGSQLLDIMTQIISPLSDAAKGVRQIYDSLPGWLKKEDKTDNDRRDWIKKIAQEADKAALPKWPIGNPDAPKAGGGN